MQTLEKIAHSTMPFTTGGQTINDRLTAAKYSIAGSQLGKTVCKATTEELMAPKKKHLDYLLHCTNEPNVSIPTLANLLIERTQNINQIVVYKALITIHNLMCYGNERFSQYLASCNATFNMSNLHSDKSTISLGALVTGYDMSIHVKRYGKYISEKISTYRLCAFDFCKVKRGRDDGLLRTLHTDKLLKTMPTLQSLIDSLLEFQVNTSELNNGVINCSFILMFRDLIRLFACYNDGVINLLEKFFDMNKKQCREGLDLYKAFLARIDRVQAFLSIAESVGVDRGEIPDLARAPASLLEALESHLLWLEGGRGPPPTSNNQQIVTQQIYSQQQAYHGNAVNPILNEAEKQRYLEEERERLRMFEEQRKIHQQSQTPQTNPFSPTSHHQAPSQQLQSDLINFYETPRVQANGMIQIDSTNPFASLLDSSSQGPQGISTDSNFANPFSNNPPPAMQQQTSNPFNAQPPILNQPLSLDNQYNGYGANSQQNYSNQPPPYNQSINPQFASYQQNLANTAQFTPMWPPTSQPSHQQHQPYSVGKDIDGALSSLVGNLGLSSADQRQAMASMQKQGPAQMQQPLASQQFSYTHQQNHWNQTHPMQMQAPSYFNPYQQQQPNAGTYQQMSSNAAPQQLQYTTGGSNQTDGIGSSQHPAQPIYPSYT